MDDLKKKIRKEMIRLLENIPADAKKASDEGIISRLLAMPEYMDSRCVFVYHGVDWEIDTRPVILHALEHGKKVALPLCFKDGVMEARRITSLEELVPGRYKGIPEQPGCAPFVERTEIDFAVVPCVCADRKCFRLGHGGGYYDRFLKDRSFFAAALCRSTALMEAVPADEFDVRCDCVVTESMVIR